MTRLLVIMLTLVYALGYAATAQAQEKFDWTYFSGIPTTHNFNANFIIPAFDKIRERTDGNVDIRFAFLPETPFKFPDMLTVIRDGQAEMVGWMPSYTSATYPSLAAVSLPFLSPNSVTAEEAVEIADSIYATPALEAEMDRVLGEHDAMVLGHYYAEPMNFWFLKPVSTVAEMKDLKLRVFTPELAELISQVGAVPVNISSPEVYSSLQRGVIDGVITGIGNMRGPKWSEVLKAGLIANIMLVDFFDIVSKTAFDKLPPEYQTIVSEEMAAAAKGINEYILVSVKKEREVLSEDGFFFADISDEDYQLLRKISEEKVWPGWKERSGPEAAAVLDGITAKLESANQ